MAYRWDVFLSYRRFGEWPRWVNDHFLQLFRFYLGEELGRDPRIFVDTEEIQSGSTWPLRLAECLAESQVLVCLWSRTYFSSHWCAAELAHMRAREVACGFGNPVQPGGLIVPIVLHDGEDFPPSVRHIQTRDFRGVANPRMATGSARAEQLADTVRDWVPDVRAAITRAPAFDPGWRLIAADHFLEAFREPPKQNTLPGLGAV